MRIALLRQVSEEITRKMEGKRPIIIFEDLDKLNPKDAWEVFYNYSALLSGMRLFILFLLRFLMIRNFQP